MRGVDRGDTPLLLARGFWRERAKLILDFVDHKGRRISQNAVPKSPNFRPDWYVSIV